MAWSDVPCKLWNDRDWYPVRMTERGTVGLHVLTWIDAHGPIPWSPTDKRRMSVCHHCDTPACYEIEHLFLGTQADNMADMVAKGRHRNQVKTHCPHGHEYTEENTYITPRGGRKCRECHRIETREAKRAKSKKAKG